MEGIIYEKDEKFVIERLLKGELDYIDCGNEVFEADLFRYIKARKYLMEISETYPTPRKKEEVPLWLFNSSRISMCLHGVNSFDQYGFVIRCGGMMAALGPKVGTKAVHPETGNTTLHCPGFNNKNDYDRETPCDQDYLRKLARDTLAERLFAWNNQDVARVFKKHKVFDRNGIFIGDGSYLFVPDNEAYEHSVVMLFDKHNHPVDPKEVPPGKMADYQWRRCYKMVSLLHTNPEGDFFIVAAVKVLPGNAHECPVLYDLVEEFTGAVGDGVIKRLILDRGFIDGEKIGWCKLEHGIDVLIPVKRSMDLYQDALELLGQVDKDFEPWQVPELHVPPPSAPKPERIEKREASRQKTLEKKKQKEPPPLPKDTVIAREVVKISELRSWQGCPVPVNLALCTDTYADGHFDLWMLLDTDPTKTSSDSRNDYHLRVQIEERHRQFKGFSDLTNFTSRAFSLIANQVVFLLLTYNFIQIFLRSQSKKKALSNKPIPNIRRQLLPSIPYVIVYCQQRVAFLNPLHFTQIILNLEGEAKKKAQAKVNKLRIEFMESLRYPRPP